MDALSRSLIDALGDGLAVVDATLTVVEWNGAMERLTGLARADAIGRSADAGLPLLRSGVVLGRLREAQAGGTPAAVELLHATSADGRPVWLEARCAPWRDGAGRVAGVLAFFTDITERHQRALFLGAMEAIGHSLASSLELNEVLDTIADKALAVMGAESALVVAWDGVAPTLTVLRAGGRLAAEYAAASTIPAGRGPIARAMREGRPVTTRNILTDPGVWLTAARREQIAREGYKAVAAAPLAAKGRVHGALVVHYWEERTFADEELAALSLLAEQASLAIENAQVYESARDSVVRLRETQAQLVQAAKMSALGQLVSGVAHELNNPLSVIIGYGQLLLSREIPPALQRPIELMVAQGDRMAKIVRNLLFFARQRPPERLAVSLNEILERTLALRLNQLTLSGITVEREYARELPLVAGDPYQLEQVFLNLLLNAEQALQEGKRGGRIVLRTGVAEEGRAVAARVSDDGPGIPPETLPHVFEPFFTTKTVGVGTGLGLSVSYGIVEEHGGRLAVESRRGETVFVLTLPALRPGVLPADAPAAALEAARGDGRLALVVEDEPSVLDLIVTLLGQSGWRVDVASGGHAGFERVKQHRYELVVSDMRMAEGGGEEFYRRAVAQDPSLQHRFVFITGDTVNRDAWRFFKEARVPVIEKPFQPALFLDVVRRATTGLTPSTPGE